MLRHRGPRSLSVIAGGGPVRQDRSGYRRGRRPRRASVRRCPVVAGRARCRRLLLCVPASDRGRRGERRVRRARRVRGPRRSRSRRARPSRPAERTWAGQLITLSILGNQHRCSRVSGNTVRTAVQNPERAVSDREHRSAHPAPAHLIDALVVDPRRPDGHRRRGRCHLTRLVEAVADHRRCPFSSSSSQNASM